MSLEENGIEYKKFGGGLFASIRGNMRNRQEIASHIQLLQQSISQENILGPAVMVRNFIHSYSEGLDVEVGFPMREPVHSGQISTHQVQTRRLPEYDVLAKRHSGGLETLGDAYNAVFGCQDEYGLISDEFCIEVLHDNDPTSGTIEVMMVLHNWQALFGEHLNRVMGEVVRDAVMEDSDTIFLESQLSARFEWTKSAVERFNQVSDDYQRYEVISSCSHIYPCGQAEKLRAVYLQAIEHDPDMYKAVDAVIEFMDEDPGWSPGQRVRDGDIVFITKRPRDPAAYEKASTDLERKQAACFCPIVRAYMEDGMPPTFCYCSTGFERKQWEVALGQPVKIDVVQSLLKGNMQCQFALRLPG